ncbi:uncharacterized protein P884DRAFT_254541 [Thermothelomyces heterothallicus CBS 202.75]|uniref:uncharacterized protein n=1 Tax=Thermothelomyces heterothallicus CBS 202.75 TaxID=1149848 RepID=UPI00374370B4
MRLKREPIGRSFQNQGGGNAGVKHQTRIVLDSAGHLIEEWRRRATTCERRQQTTRKATG